MKPVITWILVADGARARVLENTGPGKGLSEVDGLEFANEHLAARDIMADKPGRTFASAGTGRSSKEPPTDPVAHREMEFVKTVAETLEKKRQKGAFDRLILVAAPRALGDLRQHLPNGLKDAVYAELAKDLTRVPNTEMPKHLEGVLAV